MSHVGRDDTSRRPKGHSVQLWASGVNAELVLIGRLDAAVDPRMMRVVYSCLRQLADLAHARHVAQSTDVCMQLFA